VRGHPVAGVRLHFGRWATAREDLRVLPAFATRSACVSACCGRARALVAGVREFCCGRRAKQRSGRRRPAPAQTATVDAAKRLSKIVYTSRFVRVILAQGPC